MIRDLKEQYQVSAQQTGAYDLAYLVWISREIRADKELSPLKGDHNLNVDIREGGDPVTLLSIIAHDHRFSLQIKGCLSSTWITIHGRNCHLHPAKLTYRS